MSVNTAPRLASGNVVDRRGPNPQVSRNSADGLTSVETATDVGDVYGLEFATMHTLAVDASTSFVDVGDIVSGESKEEVFRVDARRNIASVPDDHPLRDSLIVGNLPSGCVGEGSTAVCSADCSIAEGLVASSPDNAPIFSDFTASGESVRKGEVARKLMPTSERVSVESLPSSVAPAILKSSFSRVVAFFYFALLSVHCTIIQHCSHHERMAL